MKFLYRIGVMSMDELKGILLVTCLRIHFLVLFSQKKLNTTDLASTKRVLYTWKNFTNNRNKKKTQHELRTLSNQQNGTHWTEELINLCSDFLIRTLIQ